MFYKCVLSLTPVESNKMICEGVFILDCVILIGAFSFVMCLFGNGFCPELWGTAYGVCTTL